MSNSNPSISLDQVATFPRPGTVIPTSLAFADKGRSVTYLFSDTGSLVCNLYAVSLADGTRTEVVKAKGGGDTEANLSAEEKLERERRRERGLGVTRYAWSSQGDVLLVPLGGTLYVQDGLKGTLRAVDAVDGKSELPAAGPVLGPQLSRDGSQLAYVQDNDIYVVDTQAGATPRRLTHGGSANRVRGLAEYIAQEEMDRYKGFWWSADGTSIAFTEVDETHIPAYRIMHQGSESTGEVAQEDHGYPFAGAENAKVRLGVVPVEGGEPTWMDLGDSQDIYLARVHWMPNGELWAEIENREQTQLDVLRFDLKTGTSSTVLKECSDIWINLHHSFRPLQSGGFVWASERTGFKHLYHYDSQGALIGALTSGEWPVDELVGVDESSQTIYFLSGKEDPTQAQLYKVGFDGGEPHQITTEPGMHQVQLDGSFSHFIDTCSSANQAPRVHVRSLTDGSIVTTIFDTPDPAVETLALLPPEFVSIQSRDGETLHAAMYRPPAHFKAPYPTVVSVYGGPHAQFVSDSWAMTVDMRAQYLRSQGYLVFKLDNRGSARRGLGFEGKIKHDMGRVEILDQVDGVNWLVENGIADPARVGMFGWSYGGYMSAMALARAPETFHVAIAGAPVTHWDGYDTHYTERYMGTPQSNPTGYTESSVMHHLGGMQGDLMLVHGLMDENVHFRHSARLINALIEAEKDYELLLFPNERHMPRSQKDRLYMETRMIRFLRKYLYER